MNEHNAFFFGLRLIMEMEENLRITVPDETVESVSLWENLTLDRLVTITGLCGSIDSDQIRSALESSVRKEFPKAPLVLDFHAPLIEALGKKRYKVD